MQSTSSCASLWLAQVWGLCGPCLVHSISGDVLCASANTGCSHNPARKAGYVSDLPAPSRSTDSATRRQAMSVGDPGESKILHTMASEVERLIKPRIDK